MQPVLVGRSPNEWEAVNMGSLDSYVWEVLLGEIHSVPVQVSLLIRWKRAT